MKTEMSFKTVLFTTGLVLSSITLAPNIALADYKYEVHESRSDVRHKNRWIKGTKKVCSWGVKKMYSKAGPIVAKIVCSAGDAGMAYETAAASDCKMLQDITIHTSGYGSYNKSTVLFFPYDCRG